MLWNELEWNNRAAGGHYRRSLAKLYREFSQCLLTGRGIHHWAVATLYQFQPKTSCKVGRCPHRTGTDPSTSALCPTHRRPWLSGKAGGRRRHGGISLPLDDSLQQQGEQVRTELRLLKPAPGVTPALAQKSCRASPLNPYSGLCTGIEM